MTHLTWKQPDHSWPRDSTCGSASGTLVRNPLLRRTLLDTQPVSRPPDQTAAGPAGAAQRAGQRVTGELNDRATQDTVASQLGQLTAVGWQNLGRGMFRLPLTGSFSRWEGDEPEPLVFLTLLILKRQAYVYPHAAYYNHPDGDAARYVSEHQGPLERIAAPGELVMRPVQSVIWRECGGWADDIYWPEWAARIAQRTTGWTDAFQELCSITLEIHNGTRPYPQRNP